MLPITPKCKKKSPLGNRCDSYAHTCSRQDASPSPPNTPVLTYSCFHTQAPSSPCLALTARVCSFSRCCLLGIRDFSSEVPTQHLPYPPLNPSVHPCTHEATTLPCVSLGVGGRTYVFMCEGTSWLCCCWGDGGGGGGGCYSDGLRSLCWGGVNLLPSARLCVCVSACLFSGVARKVSSC